MAISTKNLKTTAATKKKETKAKKNLPTAAEPVKGRKAVSAGKKAKETETAKTKAKAAEKPNRKEQAANQKQPSAKAASKSAPASKRTQSSVKSKKPETATKELTKITAKPTKTTSKSSSAKAAKTTKTTRAKKSETAKKVTKAVRAKKVAARSAEDARTPETKEKDAIKSAAVNEESKSKSPATSSATAQKVAKTLIRRKVAKKGEAKAKPSKPIAFTLDEALEIAKAKPETGETETNGNGKSAPVKSPQKREIPDDLKQENRTLGAASIADILGYNPSAGPKKEEDEEVPAKFARYYKLLLELREHVMNGLDIHTKETLKRSAKEDSGNLSSYSQHMADAGTDTFDRDFALSLVSSEQDALYEIEDAIRRIKQGTYGVCEITGKPIKKERLLAVPFTKFSVEGQAEYERTQRRTSNRGGAFGDTPDDMKFMDDDSDD